MKTWIMPALLAVVSWIGALLAKSEPDATFAHASCVFFCGVTFICQSIDKSRDGGAK